MFIKTVEHVYIMYLKDFWRKHGVAAWVASFM